jgi:hypothetical protein
MLARLSMATARLLDVHFEPSDMSTLEDETLVSFLSYANLFLARPTWNAGC